MRILETTSLTPTQKTQILRLWNNEYSVKLAYDPAGFETYLNNLKHKIHYLLVSEKDEVLGWFFLFECDGDDWFAMILDSSIHRKGYGSMLLNKAKETFPRLLGWATDHNRDYKSNGTPYLPPVDFYIKNGFTVLHDQRLDIEKLSAVKISWERG